MEKILIVDDSVFQLKMLSDKAKEIGCEVITAKNGNEALEKITDENPDCVLLDLLMPEKSGIEVLEDLQALENKTPVIVVSADVQESIRSRCLELGAFDFINKPPKKNRLQETIHRALSLIRG